MIINHSTRGQKAYHALLTNLQNRSIASKKGELVLETRASGQFWYDKYVEGTATKYSLIGKDSPELSSQVERIAEISVEMEDSKENIAKLIETLQDESYQFFDPSEGDLLSEFSDAGVFRLGGVLIGTTAFKCYEYALGAKIESKELLQTKDIDIASNTNLTFVLDETVSPDLQAIFEKFSYEEIPTPNSIGVCKWNNPNSGLIVEFMTPWQAKRVSLTKAPDLTSGGPEIAELTHLGVHALELKYMEYLLEDPVQVALLYNNGILVRVPQPMRFAIHKLIVAEIRKKSPDNEKSNKDRLQALWLIRKMAIDFPDELSLAVNDAKARGKKWKRNVENSINRVPEIREILDDLPTPDNNDTILGSNRF